jgi:single-stranded DNA-binding protein
MNYNKIILIGRLTKDFEKKGDKWGVANLAVNDNTPEKNVHYFNLTITGEKRISFFETVLKKGTLICIDGEMKSKKVDDKVFWNVMVDNLKLLEGKKEQSSKPSEDVFFPDEDFR